MIGYLILVQAILAVTQARPHYDENDYIFNELFQYDANLNPGFDLDQFRTEQLNAHNHHRALHGVPLMSEDPILTEEAQAYAEQEATKAGELKHCKLPSCDRDEAGENLYQMNGTVSTEANPTESWYSESDWFNYCHGDDPNNLKRPGYESKDIGHFTQIVWKDSVHLGIGYARSPNRTKIYVVGRYKVHGNVDGQYGRQVTKPSNIADKYQDNCQGISGGYSSWSAPGDCTRKCGGGVKLLTKTCTNPKPSLNGRDCIGPNKKLADPQWCNIEKCEGTKSHRDLQCEVRGHLPKSYIFQECILNCYQADTGKYLGVGTVDDGTHCNDHSGVCVLGVCQTMPKYAPPLPTSPTGGIVGSYTETPRANWWENVIFTVPEGATNVVITNKDYNNVKILVGAGFSAFNLEGNDWMNDRVEKYGSYEREYTTAGVKYKYKRLPDYSTITMTGPVQPISGLNLVLFVMGSSPAQISWSYSA